MWKKPASCVPAGVGHLGPGVYRRVQGWNLRMSLLPHTHFVKSMTFVCSFPGGVVFPRELSVKFLYCSIPSSGFFLVAGAYKKYCCVLEGKRPGRTGPG